MIIIIHGEDVVSSRKALSDFRDNKNSKTFEAKSVIVEQLVQELEGTSLFGQDRVIIIENLHKQGSKSLLDYLKTIKTTNELILWEEDELSAKALQSIPHSKTLFYPIKKTIFQFLDAIKPASGKILIKLFHQTLKTSEVELVFYMLIRHLRLMMAVLSSSKIDEVKRLQSWQLAKLERQAGLFGIDKLKLSFTKLFQIELEQKTGKSPLSLTAALDLFLLEI